MAEHIITEEWRPVVGWESSYQVSNLGSVRRISDGKLCGEWYDKYISISLRDETRYTMKLIHKLVLEAFVGPKPPGMEAAHFDGNAYNNCVNNLRWDTRKNNHRDQYRHGTRVRGESHPGAKLTEDQIRQIRAVPRKHGTSAALAREFGVSATMIGLIRNGKNWTHI